MAGNSQIELTLVDEAATCRFAEDIAMALAPGAVVALAGDLGAGKSTFARALIRALADDPALEVPSPTFTLVQLYDTPQCAIAHVDLYRIADESELGDIGFDELADDRAVLVEWPDRAGGRLPDDAVRLTFAIGDDPNSRTVSIGGAPSPRRARIDRSLAIRSFLADAGHETAQRRHLQGDASTRRYERIGLDGKTAVLMDWPHEDQRQSAAHIAYLKAARLARSVEPFVAVGTYLRQVGLSAPAIQAQDLAAGILLLEDLGAAGVVEGNRPIVERYRCAIDVLVHLQSCPRPEALPLPDRAAYRPMTFDDTVLMNELEVCLDWYVPTLKGAPASKTAAAAFRAGWQRLLAELDRERRTLVLRDFHSPNLLWLGDREGVARIGIIDFQDALIGSPAYDLASLAQDARIAVPEDVERDLVDRYIAKKSATDATFDADRLRNDYAILAAQRATRILGVFSRLDQRDGKPGYLQYIPQIRTYLARSLRHPVFAGLRQWYEDNLDL